MKLDNGIKETKKVSKRGNVRFEINPFLSSAVANTAQGTKRITNRTGDQMMVVNQATGEIVTPTTGFHHIELVDKTKFVKLYINGVKAFAGLTAAGTRMFEILYLAMQESIGKDFVYMSFAEHEHEIGRATWHRGMSELIDKGFVAETIATGKYFTNPDYLFNGDRLAFVKEYRVGVPKQTTQEKLEAAGQQRLPTLEF